jgi:hypothetical protein
VHAWRPHAARLLCGRTAPAAGVCAQHRRGGPGAPGKLLRMRVNAARRDPTFVSRGMHLDSERAWFHCVASGLICDGALQSVACACCDQLVNGVTEQVSTACIMMSSGILSM